MCYSNASIRILIFFVSIVDYHRVASDNLVPFQPPFVLGAIAMLYK
jgi:hypothetical protein